MLRYKDWWWELSGVHLTIILHYLCLLPRLPSVPPRTDALTYLWPKLLNTLQVPSAVFPVHDQYFTDTCLVKGFLVSLPAPLKKQNKNKKKGKEAKEIWPEHDGQVSKTTTTNDIINTLILLPTQYCSSVSGLGANIHSIKTDNLVGVARYENLISWW